MNKQEKLLRADLKDEINDVESALSDTYENLKEVTDSELVDFYTYQIKSYEAKHRYLIEKIKEL
jgi:succinate dehydrogenase flavin-adding protein (antitoxin of CptAB toxin-antitoxin module)